MTDPLLTIDDATREFRASPKTIRRRLVAGEIEGAYKRPGSRGPEWVMPRASLAAAGFVRRNVGPSVELPADPEEQAGYWEQRALDAEAALEVARQGSAPAPVPTRRGPAGWAFVLAALVVGVLAGLLATRGGDDPPPVAQLHPSHEAARATLAASTEPTDVIGVVGRVPVDALPVDRQVVLVDIDELAASGPHYLVGVATAETASSWAQVRDEAEVVARVPVPEGVVELLDVSALASVVPAEGAAPPPADARAAAPRDPAPDAAAAPTSSSATVPSSDGPSAVDPGAGGTADPGAGDLDVATTATWPAEVSVGAGASFWSVAVELAALDGGSPTTAQVATIWTSLIDANADRLVEPGNPDVLHVGQVLVVPALG